MLQEVLKRGSEKWADKPDSNVREGSSAELGICSRPAWGSAYYGKSSKRPPRRWWIFRWILAVDFLVAKYKRKIRRKNPPENPPAENQKSASPRPPQNPPGRPKNPPQNLPTNPPVKPPSTRRFFFPLRRLALGGVFRAWILIHSLAAFWAWSRFPC